MTTCYKCGAEVDEATDVCLGCLQPQSKQYPKGSLRNPKADSRPQFGLWAPGDYMNTCYKCGDHFIGDKRAGWCADCAYADSPVKP